MPVFAAINVAITPDVTTGHIGDSIEIYDHANAKRWDNEINVMHAAYGAIDGGSAATNTTAIIDAITDIVGTGKPGAVVIPAGVVLPVTPDDIEGASDVWFIGGGTLSTSQTTLGALITFPDGSDNCGVDGLRFVSPNNEIVAVASVHNDDVTVRNCKAFGPRLWVGGTGVYADNDETNATTNATIVDNTCIATTLVNVEAAIWAYYVRGATISGNTIVGHAHGIVGWGGDANPGADGALANDRKAKNLTITGNTVADSGGGGIWFSMGEDITVAGNTVRDCGDVGIDFEGCYGATASGNTVSNCTGGCLTTFSYNRQIVFSANTCSQPTAMTMARVQNGGDAGFNHSVKFVGNTFISKTSISGVSIEPTVLFEWKNNTCWNVIIDTLFNNQGDTVIEDNAFWFDVAGGAAFSAIKVGGNHNNPRMSICRNKVRSTVAQPAGSYAVNVSSDDPNTYPIITIDHNDVPGWGTLPIRVAHTGSNPGVYCLTHVGWNNLGEGTGIDRVETGAGKSVMKREGNRQHGIYAIPGAIPGSGYWDVGEEAILTPTAGGNRGAVCTTAGSPGTWKNFGAISA